MNLLKVIDRMQLITFNYRILMISINLPKYKFKYLSREYSKNQLELVKGNSYYLYKYKYTY